jgi:hypothetical protein
MDNVISQLPGKRFQPAEGILDIEYFRSASEKAYDHSSQVYISSITVRS